MLLPITAASQTLQAIIDASAHTTEIRGLLKNWYTTITLTEWATAAYKDNWLSAVVLNSRPITTSWITFKIVDVSDVNIIGAGVWTIQADFNA